MNVIQAKTKEAIDTVFHKKQPGPGERKVRGYAVFGPNQPLKEWSYIAKPLGPNDVEIKISYCGVCHTDIAFINNDLNMSSYPFIPGHEIIGTITEVGSDVKNLKKGQRVGVGFFRSSCHKCGYCTHGEDNLCKEGEPTFGKDAQNGGFADYIRVDSEWAFPIPESLPSDQAAPLLCAGITVYSPLRRTGVGKGSKVAIMGMGGLGHIFVQMARAMGCEVYVLSTTPQKEEDAKKFGAYQFVDINNAANVKALEETFDLLLSTIYEDWDWNLYFQMVKANGTMCLVGWSKKPAAVGIFDLIYRQRKLIGSNVGSAWMTREMLEFCAKHNIVADIQTFSIHEVDKVIKAFKEIPKTPYSHGYRAVLKIEGEYHEEEQVLSQEETKSA